MTTGDEDGSTILSVTVNAQTCIGCGRCVGTVPGVFRMRKGKSQVRESPDLVVKDDVLQAERQCPSKSIRVQRTP
ncbi:MAG: ferredoxin [Candidatus Sericytochromatia bacterium]|nr:ferredoxin [Candidatus Sericytochromatia bacterium]